jgi:hypothetical protein
MVEQIDEAISRQRLRKHGPAATTEEQLAAVFSMRSLSRPYNEDLTRFGSRQSIILSKSEVKSFGLHC